MRRLEGRVALVTGGGHGIGRASVVRLAEEGAIVSVLDVNKAHAMETAEIVSSSGGNARGYAVDVTSESDVAAAVEATRREHGRIDILHNNAGVLIAGTTLELDPASWDRTIEVNLRGVFICVRAVLPHMLEQSKGAIVNTASVGGLFGVARLAAYSASKGALVNYTRQLALDYTRLGVRTNCVCPGWIPTGFNDPVLAGTSDADLANLIDQAVPAGRQGDPAEIAAAVAFLVSDDASYISGHALVVDGGLTASI